MISNSEDEIINENMGKIGCGMMIVGITFMVAIPAIACIAILILALVGGN